MRMCVSASADLTNDVCDCACEQICLPTRAGIVQFMHVDLHGPYVILVGQARIHGFSRIFPYMWVCVQERRTLDVVCPSR